MPRFIRGGRGLYRKIMSTNGVKHSLGNNATNEQSHKDSPTINNPSKKVNNVFKWVAIIFAIALGVSLAVSCNNQDDSQIVANSLISVVIFLCLLFLTLIAYVIVSTITTINRHDSNEVSEHSDLQTETSQDNFLSETQQNQIIKLTDKYYVAIKNYAERRHPCNKYGFAYILWRDTNWSFAGNEFYVFSEKNSALEKIITNDWGVRRMEQNKYRGYFHPDTLSQDSEQLTFLLKSIRDKVKENTEWGDENSFDIALYFIIRNGLIKYYESAFEKAYPYKTIGEVAKAVFDCKSDDEQRHLKYLYIYYAAYHNDIFAPLKAFKDTLLNKIDKSIDELKYNEYVSKLYIPSTELTEVNAEKSVQPVEESALSPLLTNEDIDDIAFNPNTFDSLPTIEKIDMMTGRQFERFIANFFGEQGYITTLTPQSGDYGIDVIIENNIVKIGIQVKRYSEKVTNTAIQEAVTGLKHYGLDKAMVITNSYFQPSAIELAKDNGVILWDRDKLIKELK